MKADLDIIIPCFNAKDTISDLLDSIKAQEEIEGFKVYLINDASDYDYQEEVKEYSKFFYIEEIILEENGGPGVARREGINKTSSKYILFIDSDDTLYDKLSLKVLYENALDYDLLISNFIHEKGGVRSVKEKDKIWLHGKVYRREFLDKYNINFNDTRANEDNGFNRLILLLKPKTKYIENITYVYRDNANSITRSNNRDYLISGLEGFAYNMKWAMEEALKRGADKAFVPKLMTSCLVSMYYDYLYTLDRPNNKDILKYSKMLIPYYLEYDRVSEEYLNHCFSFKENGFKKEKKDYKKVISFEEFIDLVINYNE